MDERGRGVQRERMGKKEIERKERRASLLIVW